MLKLKVLFLFVGLFAVKCNSRAIVEEKKPDNKDYSNSFGLKYPREINIPSPNVYVTKHETRLRRQLKISDETSQEITLLEDDLSNPLFREDVDSILKPQTKPEIESQQTHKSFTVIPTNLDQSKVSNNNFLLSKNFKDAVGVKEAQRIVVTATTSITQRKSPASSKDQPSTHVSIQKFHVQDEFGQASFGHITPDQSASNFRDAHGNQIGHFSYIDPNGKEIIVQYSAGVNGFQVVSNAQPEASAGVNVISPSSGFIEDSPDVLKARQEHLALFEEARNRIKHPKILKNTA